MNWRLYSSSILNLCAMTHEIALYLLLSISNLISKRLLLCQGEFFFLHPFKHVIMIFQMGLFEGMWLRYCGGNNSIRTDLFWSKCISLQLLAKSTDKSNVIQTAAFLHENNMTHGDLLPQNMCMDVILPRMHPHRYYTGYHVPGRRYVLIDFETSQIHHGSGPHSPKFEKSRRYDIYRLARSLSVNLRVRILINSSERLMILLIVYWGRHSSN
jgi:hypothetical protein